MIAALLAAVQDRRAASLRAQARMQTPLAAAVRAAVISAASRIATGSPSASLTTITPEMNGSPRGRIVREAGDPLEGDGVGLTEIRGHRVQEGIGAGMHADLRRHLDGVASARYVSSTRSICRAAAAAGNCYHAGSALGGAGSPAGSPTRPWNLV